VQLHRAQDRITAAGARLVLVGNGAPSFIAGFREETGVTGALYTDPTLATYRALELRRGVGGLLGRTWLHAARAMRAGFRQGRIQGDAFQLGGVLVVRPDGAIVYRHPSAEAGDHPPVDELLRALGAVESGAAARAP
jgi:hypothetical protein